jgi:hypothetical protein
MPQSVTTITDGDQNVGSAIDADGHSFIRGAIVAVDLGDGTALIGIVGEKVAGGLFEVVLEDEDGHRGSGVFRLDQLKRLSGAFLKYSVRRPSYLIQ